MSESQIERFLADYPIVDLRGGTGDDSKQLLPIEQLLDTVDPDVVGRIVLIQPWAVAVTTNIEQAVVLSQLAYWITGRRGTHSISADPGRGLPSVNTARSSIQIAEATGQTEGGVDHVLGRLRENGLIEWRSTLFAGCKVRHIWLGGIALELCQQTSGGRKIAFHVWLAKYLADLTLRAKVSRATMAYVASQLLFWYGARTDDRAKRPLINPPIPEAGLPEHWFYKRNTELSEELGLSCEKVDRVMTALKEIGLLGRVKCEMWRGKRTNRVMLITSAWQEAIASVSEVMDKK